MQLISNWQAYPSGGAITITGLDTAGAEVKVQGIARIETTPRLFFRHTYALNRHGRRLARLV